MRKPTQHKLTELNNTEGLSTFLLKKSGVDSINHLTINDVNLLDYLIENKYRVDRVVIDYNGEIVKKAEFSKINSTISFVSSLVSP